MGVGKGFLTNLLLPPKIAKEHAVLFLISTLNDGDAIKCVLLLQYPQFTQPLNLMRVFYEFLALGKLGYGEVFFSLMIGDRLSFSSHLKCCQEVTR